LQERTRYENRILALLATQGIRERPSLRTWERDLATLQTGDGRALPKLRSAEINRLRRRLVLTMELIRELDAERTAALDAAPDDAACQKITALCRIRGIGENFAAVLVREVLYRPFANRKQLASYVGLTQCPIRAAAWIETAGLAGPATREPALPWCSSPGSGCATNPTARWQRGSASALAR
jgi:transposase